MKIGITTFYTESYESLAAIVSPNLKRYADKHSYDLHINIIPDGNFHFIKTKDCRKLLDEFDVVWVVEGDILITNHNFKIENFIQYGTYLTICKDINNFNGGSFIIRKSKWSKDLLDLINSFESIYGDEQNFMERWFDSDLFGSIIGTLKHPSINSIPYEYYHNFGYINYKGQPMPTHEMGNWEIGDFVCHLPGKTLQERIEIFNQIKEHIIL